jgi:hypothetical protein
MTRLPRANAGNARVAGDTAAYMESTGFWPPGGTRQWGLISLHCVAAIPITASTSALARWCITRGSPEGFGGGRWKRFLSLVLPPDILWDLHPGRHRNSTAGKSYAGRAPE